MFIKNTALIFVKGFLVLTVMLTLFSCGEAEIDDQQVVNVAKKYLEQNKIREAVLELKNALQANPDNGEARYLLGVVNLDIGDAASAEKEFRRALDAGWSKEKAYIGLARAMINRKALRKMINEVKINKNYSSGTRADLYALHALAMTGLGEIEQARELLDNGVKLDPKAFHVLKAKIQIQLAAKDIKSASKTVEQALAIYGDSQEILLLSAITALKNKENQKATAGYQKIVELDPVGIVSVYGWQARLALARLAIVDGALDQAHLMLMPLFKQNAQDPETNYVGGLLAFEQKKLDLAEERMLTVLKVAPEHGLSQLLFGTISYAQEDYEQAAYYIAKYLSVKPDNLGARKLLGKTYIKLGQHDDAQTTLQAGSGSGSNDAELLALVGLSQLQSGDTASGIAGLEKAVNAVPESSSLRSQLAKAYITAGETESAIRELNTILAEGDDNKQAKALLISAHMRAGHFDQAIDVALDMVKKNPQDPVVLTLAGNVFMASDDRPEARKYFSKALKIKPGYLPATMLLAKLEELNDEPLKAIALYKKLAATEKESIAPLMALARLAQAKNQTTEMLSWLEQARKKAPDNIKPGKVLAEYYLRTKQFKKAASLVNEAIEIAPRDNALLTMQARLFMAGGQYNKALTVLRELVGKLPDSVFVRSMLGEAYIKLNQDNEARKQLIIVFEKQPYYIPALVQIAGIELRSGKYEKAAMYAEQIKKTQPDLYVSYELAGDIFMAKKKYLVAKTNYELAWLRKQNTGLVIKLSQAATGAGQSKEAIQVLLSWLDGNPDDMRVLEFLGTAYQSTKQEDKAIKVFEKILNIQPDNVVVLNNLAWLYSLAKNSKALALAEKAYRLNPGDSGVQDTYGWVLVQQGQADKGVRILAQAVKALPGVPEVQYHYAVALLKTGEDIQARQILEKLLDDGRPFEGRGDAERLMK